MNFSILQGKPSAATELQNCLCIPLFLFPPPSKEQVLHKPTIYIGLKFKRWSNHASQMAASSILPTLCACEWGMIGAVLSAGERQRFDDVAVKQAGKNREMNATLCGSPLQNPGVVQMRLHDPQFNQNRIHGRKLCLRVFTYHRLK